MFAPFSQILIALLFVVGLMSLLWQVQRRTKNAGIVDVAWSGAIGVLGIFFTATSGGDPARRLMAAVLIGAWSLRLTSYLYRRVVSHPEEGRYDRLRAQWGDAADRRFFWFFQIQAVAALVFSLPVLVVSWNPAELAAEAAVASLLLWTTGVAGLYLADRQLEQFKSDPTHHGKTCRVGLWRYSRHPNYFFEWIHWWAYLPLAISSTYWWIALAVPLILFYLLMFVTGIPPTEAQALASRGEDYRRYQRTTSAFFPWFPRKDSV